MEFEFILGMDFATNSHICSVKLYPYKDEVDMCFDSQVILNENKIQFIKNLEIAVNSCIDLYNKCELDVNNEVD